MSIESSGGIQDPVRTEDGPEIWERAEAFYIQEVLYPVTGRNSPAMVMALLQTYHLSHEKTPEETWDGFLIRCLEQDFGDGFDGCLFQDIYAQAFSRARSTELLPDLPEALMSAPGRTPAPAASLHPVTQPRG